MVARAWPLLALIALAGCLSTPPSGVITCQNDCPITGFYCATDGYCWQNGEQPTSTSSGSGTSGSAGSTGASTGTSGGSSGTGATSGSSGKLTTGSSTGL